MSKIKAFRCQTRSESRYFLELAQLTLDTPPMIDLLCMKNWGTQWTIEISYNEKLAPKAIEKIKIMGTVFELPAKEHCQFSPFGPFSLG